MENFDIFDQVTDAIKQQLRNGRTQTELAQELNLHQSTICSITTGRRQLGRKALIKIFKANPAWLKEIKGA